MTETHKNFMDGESFDINNPLTRLRVAASSCFFGEPMYYHTAQASTKTTKGRVKPAPLTPRRVGNKVSLDKLGTRVGADWDSNPARALETAIDAALDYDIESTLRFAAELRRKLNIRTTPQVIMVRAANHEKIKGTPHLRVLGNRIMKRLDDAMVQAEYQLAKFGKPIPSRLKRAWARRLESAKPYELAKYRREGHTVNIFDIVNISHPRPTVQPAINSLMKGELKLGSTGDIRTWESIRAAGGGWSEAAEAMGHMALLRNLRNLHGDGIVDQYLEKLKAGVERGNQLPFRYYSAYKALQEVSASPKTLEAVEDCVGESIISQLPHFNGRTMLLSDNSGSAWGAMQSKMGTMHVADIGNLMAVCGAKASDEGYVGVFGDRLTSLPIKQSSRVFDVLQNVSHAGRQVGGGTENGIWLFWDKAIRKKEHWDHVFVLSDMQAGHGGLYGINAAEYKEYGTGIGGRFIDVPKLIGKYRDEVNPYVMVYLIQTAGYQDTLVPEVYDRTFILGGWSEHIFHYAAEMNEIFG